MEEHGVVPDIIDTVPPKILQVTYGSEKVGLGNELTPTQVKDVPVVTWDPEPGSYYTLVMTDPDAPSRKEPILDEIKHWLVVNIPENNIDKGDTLAEYVGSGPPQGSGLHRYIFLLYKQHGKLQFDEPRITNRSGNGRMSFSVTEFAAKYGLGEPVAGNFFQSQYEKKESKD